MPELPDPSDDLARSLRAEAARLDAEAAPITADAARRGTAASTPPRRWLPAAAAVVVLAAVGAAWLLATNDDDPDELIVPAGSTTTTLSPTSSTDPTSTTTTDPRHPTDFSSLPEMGIAVETPGGLLRILDLDGTELYVANQPVEALDGPSFNLMDLYAPAPIDPAEVPDGCSSAFGGGGVRVALCGDDPDRPDTILVVDSAGATRPLYDRLPFDPVGNLGVDGSWEWALPSPDGEWVVAQWHDDECGDPIAVFLPVNGGSNRAVDGLAASASRGLGWAPDGRAVVQLLEGSCVRTSPRLGIFLRVADSLLEGSIETVRLASDPGEVAYVWHNRRFENVPERMLARALDELGLEACCGEPSHGGPAVTSGAVFEGAEIGITGTPLGGVLPDHIVIQTVPLLHGEAHIVEAPADGSVDGARVGFGCGGLTWVLSWWADGPPEVDSMLLLAEALVPHLYCTLPPAG